MFQELEPEATGADGIRSTRMSRLVEIFDLQKQQNITQHQLKDYQMFWMKHQLGDHQKRVTFLSIMITLLISHLVYLQLLR